MPVPSIDILCAKLGEKCYLPDFIGHPGHTDLKDLGRDLVDYIMGIDPVIGLVPFGIISDGPDGKIGNIRGTQIPIADDFEEWWIDGRAWLTACRYATDARWHEGFGNLAETLYVGTGKPLAQYLVDEKVEILEGHSLGAPLATIVGAIAGIDLAILIESPKVGDLGFKAWANSRIKTIRSYANPRDKIPKVPLTVKFPFNIEDFEQVAPFITLDPTSTNPQISDSLWANHSLTNCRMMMEAAA